MDALPVTFDLVGNTSPVHSTTTALDLNVIGVNWQRPVDSPPV